MLAMNILNRENIEQEILGTYDNFKDLEYSLKENYNDVVLFRYNSHTLKIEIDNIICYATYRRNRNRIEIVELFIN